MALPARLITPKGEIIELTPATYRQVRKLIVARRTRRASAKSIQAGYGKYAGKTSLSKALLAERAADLEREEAKIKRWHGRK
jgi:hypothetical protein